MANSKDTPYYLSDATVREHYDALDRQTLDCGQQCKYTFDALCAAVARCAEAGSRAVIIALNHRIWELEAERGTLRAEVERLTRDGEREALVAVLSPQLKVLCRVETIADAILAAGFTRRATPDTEGE